jgi:hypothetical protein
LMCVRSTVVTAVHLMCACSTIVMAVHLCVQQQACAASVYCACSPDVAACGGVYVNGCLPCRPSPAALDSVLALRLYNLDLRIIERTMGSAAFAVAS